MTAVTVGAEGLHVQLDDAGRAEARSLAPGSSLDLVSDSDGMMSIGRRRRGDSAIGRITAGQRDWRLANRTKATTFVVENLEGGGEYIKVPPLREGVCIPFELAKIVVPLESGAAAVKVFSAPPELIDAAEAVDVRSVRSSLDRTAKYFLVLVALCEPRLRNSSVVAVPPVPAIVERLRPLPGFEQVSRTAVNYHIDYLVSNKLRAHLRDIESSGDRMNGKRDALVDIAVKYDLVRAEHLMLLPSRSTIRPAR
ncbi:serine/threonine protein kinase [Saccharothrix deserti]|uniref:serine/threonine protein kinase n=1 Tax=Saccharothrix deserti TaxID=2593674 RepID=UPI00131C6862|nr:serine/threonine protein kinase [Saccharothrix deserti]